MHSGPQGAINTQAVPPESISTTFSNQVTLMPLTDRLAALEAVPSPAGEGWRVFIRWVSGRMQYASGFASLQEAENWITNESEVWLRLVAEAQL